ncbi:MAG: class I SAM-dependent methyltransferase [Myxococcota bacterium]
MTEDSRQRIRSSYSGSGDGYDDLRLRDPGGALLSRHDLRLFDQLFQPPEEATRVVEIGAGTGRFTLAALARGVRVLATDVNESLLDALRQKLDAAGLADRCQVESEDIFKLSFEDGSVDYAYSIHVLPRFLNLDDQRAAIAEVARTLRTGGRFLFNFRNADSLIYGRFDRMHAARTRDIEGFLRGAGLRIVERRGKWLLTGRLVRILPAPLRPLAAAVDRLLWRFLTDRAWDVFIVAEKIGDDLAAGADESRAGL